MRNDVRRAVTAYDREFDLSVAEVKSLYDQLAERYEEVRQLQSLKDSLVQMIVHDFKNHLMGITGYLDLVGEKLKDASAKETRSFVNRARFHTEMISGMVSDLLDLGRLEENKLPLIKEMTQLSDIVEKSLEELKTRLEENKVEAFVEDLCGGICVDVDRKLITRVVGNVLSNAIRYSPEGGTVGLVMGRHAGVATLAIRNDGPKIPEEALTKIFEKFYQVEAKAPGYSSGTGLGLAFCDMVVKAHGGRIEAKNNAGRGCTFTVYLPCPPSVRM